VITHYDRNNKGQTGSFFKDQRACPGTKSVISVAVSGKKFYNYFFHSCIVFTYWFHFQKINQNRGNGSPRHDL